MGEASRLRARAAEIADEVLFPAALAVDNADRIPGFLALGMANRCCRLLGPSPLDAELAAACAAASDLVLRATGRLTVQTGARAVLRDDHAQRLLREAAFLLVFGNRPAIRDALLERLR